VLAVLYQVKRTVLWRERTAVPATEVEVRRRTRSATSLAQDHAARRPKSLTRAREIAAPDSSL